jgi:AraC-like DNA-binding protein
MEWQVTGWQHFTIQMGMEAFPACAFLLMIQFLRNELPPPTFWLVLLMPLMGTSGLAYISQLSQGEICVSSSSQITCLSNESLHSIYMVIMGGIIMLLMMMEIIRGRSYLTLQAGQHRDQYWLIIALVLLTVMLLVLELAALSGIIESLQLAWSTTLTRLAFVFLMFASFFRIFSWQYAIDMAKVPSAQRLLTHQDKQYALQIETFLSNEHLYREMGLSRPDLASKLGVAESRLSHIINRHFGCNFNILINRRRVQEAQDRLLKEPGTQITVIAFEVGFNSIATFNRVFKEIAGVSPSEWRNNPTEE